MFVKYHTFAEEIETPRASILLALGIGVFSIAFTNGYGHRGHIPRR